MCGSARRHLYSHQHGLLEKARGESGSSDGDGIRFFAAAEDVLAATVFEELAAAVSLLGGAVSS